MKSPKIGTDNEVTIFYPGKKVIPLKDMTTELSYKLDAIPKGRNSYFTTRYLDVLQKGDTTDDSSKWSVADRIFAVLQYGMQQNKDLKIKMVYSTPCQYCGKYHKFKFDFTSLVSNYKSPPKSWPTEKWDGNEIELRPMTGEFETLIEFQESQYWEEKLNDHPPETIEYENSKSEIEEHNNSVFFEIQFLRVAAHTGLKIEEIKALSADKFKSLLIIVQKHLKTLNYGIQFWAKEEDHLRKPGLIEHYHKCPDPDEVYMKKKNPKLLEKYKKGGLEAILITVPFRAQDCT